MYALYISYFAGQCLHLLVADDDADNTHTMNGIHMYGINCAVSAFLVPVATQTEYILIRVQNMARLNLFAFMIG